VLTYREDVAVAEALGVGTTFVQHENAVVAIYDELYDSSTMTADDVAAIAEAIAARMAAL
jgi:hypothetical protein